jgi:hypothetical protein
MWYIEETIVSIINNKKKWLKIPLYGQKIKSKGLQSFETK